MSSARSHLGLRIPAWLRVPAAFEDQPGAVFVTATVAAIGVGLLDYATGPLLSMDLLYLVPVAWSSAVAGWRVGIAVAVLSTAAGILSDVALQPGYGHRAVAAVNIGFMLITLLVVIVLIHWLRERARAALEAEQRGRDFLGFAAHQLRTPLAGITGTVDVLTMDTDVDHEREQLLAHLGTEAARAGRLINSLLRIARLDQHEPLPLRHADPHALVRDEIERAARSHPYVSWGAEFSPSLPLRIECNPDALAEALANLLDNAGRHARTAVSIDVRPVDDMIELHVHDDGPGLPLGKVEAAFQRFVTLEPGPGTGLGLPIAQGIAEAHGGTLTYDAGSFILRIPATTPELRGDDEKSRSRVSTSTGLPRIRPT